MINDSYLKLFELINGGQETFFQTGIDNIIYPEVDKIDEQWEILRNSIFSNEIVYIRGYGRNSKKTELFFSLYKELFKNENIKIDSTNNSHPTRILQDYTPFTKLKAPQKTVIQNYQISHLFGMTKNPFMFTAAWNIAYVPKWLDPFTGHESTGHFKSTFHNIFFPIIRNKFLKYIKEYNCIMNEYVSEKKLERALRNVKKIHSLDDKSFDMFSRDAKNELKIISL